MGNRTSRDNDSLGNDTQDNEALCIDPQDDSQNDPPTNFHPPQSQDSISNLERYFADLYPFQTSVMSNLNRLDFKNLQLAGVKASISQEVQNKYLISSKCDEKLSLAGFDPVPCSNTTQTVHEIKACYGKHLDGEETFRSLPEKWIEPTRYRHIRGWNDHYDLVPRSNENEGGNFDSFNVCIHCHERDLHRRFPAQSFSISDFHFLLCRDHCEEFIEQRPYNSCHCETFLEKYWRCNTCSLKTFDNLRCRARSFRGVLDPSFIVFTQEQRFPHTQCPIPGCTAQQWGEAPAKKRMWLCCACTAIFPSHR